MSSGSDIYHSQKSNSPCIVSHDMGTMMVELPNGSTEMRALSSIDNVIGEVFAGRKQWPNFQPGDADDDDGLDPSTIDYDGYVTRTDEEYYANFAKTMPNYNRAYTNVPGGTVERPFSIFCGNLSSNRSDQFLEAAIRRTLNESRAMRIRLCRDAAGNPYGFIVVPSKDYAQNIIERYNGVTIDDTDRPMRLEIAAANSIMVLSFIPGFDLQNANLCPAEHVVLEMAKGLGAVKDLSRRMKTSEGYYAYEISYKEDAVAEQAYAKLKSQMDNQWFVTWKTAVDGLPFFSGKDERTIFVTGMHESLTAEDIQQRFSQYGDIIAMTPTKRFHRQRGLYYYTHIVFTSRTSCEKAIKNENGTDWLNRKLVVEPKVYREMPGAKGVGSPTPSPRKNKKKPYESLLEAGDETPYIDRLDPGPPPFNLPIPQAIPVPIESVTQFNPFEQGTPVRQDADMMDTSTSLVSTPQIENYGGPRANGFGGQGRNNHFGQGRQFNRPSGTMVYQENHQLNQRSQNQGPPLNLSANALNGMQLLNSTLPQGGSYHRVQIDNPGPNAGPYPPAYQPLVYSFGPNGGPTDTIGFGHPNPPLGFTGPPIDAQQYAQTMTYGPHPQYGAQEWHQNQWNTNLGGIGPQGMQPNGFSGIHQYPPQPLPGLPVGGMGQFPVPQQFGGFNNQYQQGNFNPNFRGGFRGGRGNGYRGGFRGFNANFGRQQNGSSHGSRPQTGHSDRSSTAVNGSGSDLVVDRVRPHSRGGKKGRGFGKGSRGGSNHSGSTYGGNGSVYGGNGSNNGSVHNGLIHNESVHIDSAQNDSAYNGSVNIDSACNGPINNGPVV